MRKLFFLLAFLPSVLFAQSWNGEASTLWYTSTGALAQSYTIETAEDLAGLAQLVNGGTTFEGRTINLGADIVLNTPTLNGGYENWGTANEGLEQWVPIGISSNSFRGTFDGNGHTITGLYINNTSDYQGLFGYANNGGTISNLGVVESFVKGSSYVGGISGSYGTINNSYFIGTVSSTGNYVGGINGYSGTVNNSYFIGYVSGTDSYVDGIIGGGPSSNEVKNSYYNSSLLSVSNSYGIGKTDAEMKSEDFAALLRVNAEISNINTNNHYKGWVYKANSYPTLSAEDAAIDIPSFFAGGDGSSGTPYIVATKEQLKNLSVLVNAGYSFADEFFALGADIVLNTPTLNGGYENWETANEGLEQWIPIGTTRNYFQGTFDGDGHTITGLYINNTSDYQGLFGYANNGGTISNLGVVESFVKGRSYVGGISGSYGTINNSYFTGAVSGTSYSYVGGITGSYGTVNNSHFIGTVSSTGNYVGGISGYACTVNNSYIRGNVSGATYVGGIVGSSGAVNNSYVVGDVSATGGNLGGIVGSSSTVNNSYVIGNVFGAGNYVGGIVGYSGTVNNSYFVGGILGNGTSLGGIVGYGTETNSYYNTTILGPSPNGIGKTTAEMQSADFAALLRINAEISNINTNNHYKSWIYNTSDYPTISTENAVINITSFFSGGDGSSGTPYIIETKEQLKNLSVLVNAGYSFANEFFALGADIVLNSTSLNGGYQNWETTNEGLEQWIPIGNSSSNSFNGTFEGNGHTIIGLYINNDESSSYYQGLFGNADGATINNLGVVGSYIKGAGNVGGINGYGGAVNNSYFIGNVSCISSDYVGGINGYYGTVNNSYFIGNVSGRSSYYVGGISGDASSSNAVKNSYYNSSLLSVSNSYGIGKTDAEMKSEDFAALMQINAGMANVGNANSYRSWKYNEDSYPTLSTTEFAPNPIFANAIEIGELPFIKEDTLTENSIVYTDGSYSRYINSYKITTDGSQALEVSLSYSIENSFRPYLYILNEDGTIYGQNYGSGGGSCFIFIEGQTQYCPYSGLTLEEAGTFYILASGYYNYSTGPYAIKVSVPKVTSIYITSQPNLTYDEGDVLDLSGLAVRLYYDNGTTKEVAFADFEANNITTMPENGTELSYVHNGMPVKVIYDGSETIFANTTYNLDVTLEPIDIADVFESGNGTSQNPYLIMSKEQLQNFSRFVNEGNSFENEFVALGADIELNGSAQDQWMPIGDSYAGTAFEGTFDGNGHVISGLYIDNNLRRVQGLFGTANIIKNLGVIDAYVKGGDYVYYTAGIVGVGNVSNSYFIGDVYGSGGGAYVAGISAGWFNTVDNSYVVGSGGNGVVAGYNNVTNSYYNSDSLLIIGSNGTGKTTAEMQSQDFAELLRTNAGSARSGYRDWVHNANGYPTLSTTEFAQDPTFALIKTSAIEIGELPFIEEGETTEESIVYHDKINEWEEYDRYVNAYKITTDGSEILEVSLAGNIYGGGMGYNSDTYLYILRDDGTVYGRNDDGGNECIVVGQMTYCTTSKLNIEEAGTFYILASGYYNYSTGTYAIKVNERPPVGVDYVDIIPRGVNMPKGESRQFAYDVTGWGDYEEYVTWYADCYGGCASGTSIENGLLQVASDETNNTIEVRACFEYEEYNTCGSVYVELTDEAVKPILTYQSQGGDGYGYWEDNRITIQEDGYLQVIFDLSGNTPFADYSITPNDGTVNFECSYDWSNRCYIDIDGLPIGTYSYTASVTNQAGTTDLPFTVEVVEQLEPQIVITGHEGYYDEASNKITAQQGQRIPEIGISLIGSNNGVCDGATVEGAEGYTYIYSLSCENYYLYIAPSIPAGDYTLTISAGTEATKTINLHITEPPPEVYYMSISPPNINMQKGKSMQFEYYVYGLGNYGDYIEWKIECDGICASGTAIDQTGLLQVAADEVNDNIEVFACFEYEDYNTCSSAYVELTDEAVEPVLTYYSFECRDSGYGYYEGYYEDSTVTMQNGCDGYLHINIEGNSPTKTPSITSTNEADLKHVNLDCSMGNRCEVYIGGLLSLGMHSFTVSVENDAGTGSFEFSANVVEELEPKLVIDWFSSDYYDEATNTITLQELNPYENNPLGLRLVGVYDYVDATVSGIGENAYLSPNTNYYALYIVTKGLTLGNHTLTITAGDVTKTINLNIVERPPVGIYYAAIIGGSVPKGESWQIELAGDDEDIGWGNFRDYITWEIKCDSSCSSGTAISPTGLLQVATDEVNDTIEVEACFEYEKQKGCVSADIIVTDEAIAPELTFNGFYTGNGNYNEATRHIKVQAGNYFELYLLSGGTMLTASITPSNENIVFHCEHNYCYVIGERMPIGNYSFTVSVENSLGKAEFAFTVEVMENFVPPKGMNGTLEIVGATEFPYTGNAINPTVRFIHYDGDTLVKGTDYNVAYYNVTTGIEGDNVNAGAISLVAVGIGDYFGEKYAAFTITPKALVASMVAEIPEQKYYDEPIRPVPVIKDGSKTLISGTNYSLSYANNEAPADSAEVTITGIGNYSDTLTVYFTIVQGEVIEPEEVEVIWQEELNFTYNGAEQKPTATATAEDGTFIPLTITVSGATDVGAYTATASMANSMREYTLTNTTVEFSIVKATLNATVIVADIKQGGELKPTMNGNEGSGAVTWLYSTEEEGTYSSTIPTAQGVYYVKAEIAETANYLGYTTAPVSFAITKADPIQITVTWSGTTTFTYNGQEQAPIASASLNGNPVELIVSGAVNAGKHTAIAKLANASVDYELVNASKQFTINRKGLSAYAIDPLGNYREKDSEAVEPEVVVRDGNIILVKDVDYEVSYANNEEIGLGWVIVNGIGNYSGEARTQFVIYTRNATIVYVNWNGTNFTYNGTEQGPEATLEDGYDDYEIEVLGRQTDAGSYTAVAQFVEPNYNIELRNSSRPYTIARKELTVAWDEQRKFVYNKMVQYPKATLMDGEEESEVEITVLNVFSAAGVYTGHTAALAMITDDAIRNNYDLQNETVDYEITKKPLNIGFATDLPDYEYNAEMDTLWVPQEVFDDSDELLEALKGFVNYDGFATDTVKNESDDESVLRGVPSVKLAEYNGESVLAKRVNTDREAKAEIDTKEMSADNYTISKKTVVIMETEEEKDPPLCEGDECGEPVCEEGDEDCNSPILQPSLAAGNSFRVWQNASGMLSLDLGYAPAGSLVLEVRNMQGKLIATEQINARYADITLNAPKGMYVFKVGNRSTIKALR